MFAERMLDVTIVRDRLVPRFLTARHHAAVRPFLDTLLACAGQPRADVEARLDRMVGHGLRPRSRRALTQLLLRLFGFTVPQGPPPRDLRRTLFELAASSPPSSERGALLADVARQHDLTTAQLEHLLYADTPAERVLCRPETPPAVEEILDRYNLALAQGVLLRAEALTVSADGLAKSLLRQARLQRLLCLAERRPDGRSQLHLSGPLSLFRHTVKYGHAMARWLPAVVHAPGWKLSARCQVFDRRAVWHAEQGAPIGTTHLPPRPFDSALERRFFRDLTRAAPHWQVQREGDLVQLGRRIFCPDFTLVQPRKGHRVPVEIVGFWTPEYLTAKGNLIRNLPRHRRWLLCVDRCLACRKELGRLPDPVFLFDKKININEFLPFLERWVQASNNEVPAPQTKVAATERSPR